MHSSSPKNIALYGRSGSGKSTVASILVDDFGFFHCKTGRACRELATNLFGSQSKTLLNDITDALRDVDVNVWMRAALKEGETRNPIVFDSMRFPEDYAYLKERGFVLWRIDAPLDVRIKRLAERGQEFEPAVDDQHAAEASLDGHLFDLTLCNQGDSLGELRATVRRAVSDT